MRRKHAQKANGLRVEKLKCFKHPQLKSTISVDDDVYFALANDSRLVDTCLSSCDDKCQVVRVVSRAMHDAYDACSHFRDQACGGFGSDDSQGPMVECDRCLGGYHIRCLKPSLKTIPTDDWFCSHCCLLKALPTRPPLTACEQFLWGQGIVQVARICAIVRNRQGDGEVEVKVRFFIPPEATEAGRKQEHKAREVFYTIGSYYQPVDSIVKRALVCTPERFETQAGDDAFVCSSIYDEKSHEVTDWMPEEEGEVEEEVEEEEEEVEEDEGEIDKERKRVKRMSKGLGGDPPKDLPHALGEGPTNRSAPAVERTVKRSGDTTQSLADGQPKVIFLSPPPPRSKAKETPNNQPTKPSADVDETSKDMEIERLNGQVTFLLEAAADMKRQRDEIKREKIELERRVASFEKAR